MFRRFGCQELVTCLRRMKPAVADVARRKRRKRPRKERKKKWRLKRRKKRKKRRKKRRCGCQIEPWRTPHLTSFFVGKCWQLDLHHLDRKTPSHVEHHGPHLYVPDPSNAVQRRPGGGGRLPLVSFGRHLVDRSRKGRSRDTLGGAEVLGPCFSTIDPKHVLFLYIP